MECDHWMERDVEKDTSDRVSVRLDCSLLDICFLSLPLTVIRWMIWIHLDGAAGQAVVPDIARNGCVFSLTIKKVYLLLRTFS